MSIFDNVKEQEHLPKQVSTSVFNEIDTSVFTVLENESPTNFFERVYDTFKDIVSGDMFDYKIGYIANLDRDTRKAKDTILSSLTYEYIEEHFDDVYHVPYGLQLDLTQLKPYLNNIGGAVKQLESEIDSFKKILGKYISSASYRKLPLEPRDLRLDRVYKLSDMLDKITKGNDYTATGVTLGTLVGNAKEFHKTVIVISSTIHSINENDIADFQDKVKGLEGLMDAVVSLTRDESNNNEMIRSITNQVGELADAITTIGKAFYILVELSKLTTVIAYDVKG